VRVLVPRLRSGGWAGGLTLAKAVLLLQPLFKCWTGRCQTCDRPINIDRLALTLDRYNE
jgi:hypothetical protein